MQHAAVREAARRTVHSSRPDSGTARRHIEPPIRHSPAVAGGVRPFDQSGLSDHRSGNVTLHERLATRSCKKGSTSDAHVEVDLTGRPNRLARPGRPCQPPLWYKVMFTTSRSEQLPQRKAQGESGRHDARRTVLGDAGHGGGAGCGREVRHTFTRPGRTTSLLAELRPAQNTSFSVSRRENLGQKVISARSSASCCPKFGQQPLAN